MTWVRGTGLHDLDTRCMRASVGNVSGCHGCLTQGGRHGCGICGALWRGSQLCLFVSDLLRCTIDGLLASLILQFEKCKLLRPYALPEENSRILGQEAGNASRRRGASEVDRVVRLYVRRNGGGSDDWARYPAPEETFRFRKWIHVPDGWDGHAELIDCASAAENFLPPYGQSNRSCTLTLEGCVAVSSGRGYNR